MDSNHFLLILTISAWASNFDLNGFSHQYTNLLGYPFCFRTVLFNVVSFFLLSHIFSLHLGPICEILLSGARISYLNSFIQI